MVEQRTIEQRVGHVHSMKIPDYLYELVYNPGTKGLDFAARILQVEAAMYREGGQKEAAVALTNTAKLLKRITYATSPADVFDWPKKQPVSEFDEHG